MLDVRLLAKKKDVCKLDEVMRNTLLEGDCVVRGGVIKKTKKSKKKA